LAYHLPSYPGAAELFYDNDSLFANNDSFNHMLTGDFNGDKFEDLAVNIDDEIVIKVILEKEADPAKIDESDINGDGRVDALDIQISVNKQLEMEGEE
jgi:hypothetical protein